MESISVIISVYNRLDFLQKALLSIAHQSLLPSEVVVTDDGSQEPVSAFLKKIASQFPFKIKLVQQEDRGFRLARCKNNGIRVAQNPVLVFWDQDVLGTHGYLETFWKNVRPHTFVVAYPVRLSAEQTPKVSEALIKQGKFDSILTRKQINKVHKQFHKERFYYWLRKLVLRNDPRPKLRGGVFAIHKSALERVNGFDEQFQGWGNEDDDLGHRLYASGVVGFNPFYHDFPVHLYHPPNHHQGQRLNQAYFSQRKKEIRRGQFKARYGLDNPLGEDKPQMLEF